MKLTDIKPNPRNPRTITDEKLQKLKNSIVDMPKGLSIKPIIVDEDNVIIGGNQRYLALLELGYEEIPDNWVKKVIDLTEDEKKKFLIVDNVSFGEWDWGLINEDFDLDALDSWGLDVPVYTNSDIDLEDFFTDDFTEKEKRYMITLEYRKEDYDKVINNFKKFSGSRAGIVYRLLDS
jgi:hypothetical protein